MPLPLILDENQRSGGLWRAIQTHNVRFAHEALDVVRVGDHGCPTNGTLDPELLNWAISKNKVIVTEDVNTLISFHNELIVKGRATPGLFVIRAGFTIPQIVSELVIYSHLLKPEESASRCWYLPE